jgi:hypothetical protein
MHVSRSILLVAPKKKKGRERFTIGSERAGIIYPQDLLERKDEYPITKPLWICDTAIAK